MRKAEQRIWTRSKWREFQRERISAGPKRRTSMKTAMMMGMRVRVRMWLTRYWYPSFTYLSFTELEKSGKIGGMLSVSL